ncbi:BTAD domain-containing putative transcriptional regulator [Amycolatopsis sp. Hca4]|uniref:BTAD domain-containing putative transcriptional regulator n=1 Tax=Amycolatopsis sp. Hca4 TaxID=2742131 RepID=UPI0015900A99|nr:BTAD domain-containing putative transcriptional regulator [Amycolatopsis sp. Hca4]QKV74023.1 AAA family ATPase [Amycolatopsis sp. Hca4]
MSGHRLRVAVLGTLRAWLDDREVALGPARQRAVFAALAIRATAARPATRGELIEAVWGQAAPASADGSIHTYISGLRRTLEPGRTRWSTGGLLMSDAAGYRLRLDGDALDARLFGCLHEKARSRWLAGDAGGTIEILERALALWSGEALTGVPGPHAEALRTSLTRQRVLAQELRAEALLAHGGHEDLVPELTVLVREHPLREPLWRLLMTALHRGGRTTEALDTFRTAREVLRRELGTVPGPELIEAHRRILTGDPAATPPAEAGPRHRARPGGVAHVSVRHGDDAPDFRGRRPEIARLRQFADDVVAGRGRTVWVEGEPGIGKSELLAAALGDVAGRGCHLAWAAASELGPPVPLQVFTEGLGLASAAGAEQALAHVERLCASAPLVLVVDDLQWADEASVLLWNRLSAVTHRLPLLLVAASRPSGRREDLARVRRAAELRGLEVLTLEPLAPADAEALTEDLVGGRPGPRLRSLTGRAAGHPLYLREVTTALVQAGAIELENGVAELRDDTALTVPGSLLGAVDRTLAQLDEVTREAARRAAVLGTEFGLVPVAASMGLQPSALLGAFGALMELGVVVDAGTRLAFRHPLLRWAVYHEIPTAERAAWHRRAAEVLADTGAGIEPVARQLTAVPAEVDDWVTGWLAEHHAALAVHAPSVAATLLRRVLDESPPAGPHREQLLAANVRVPSGPAREPHDPAHDLERAAQPHPTAPGRTPRRADPTRAAARPGCDDAPGTPSSWSPRRPSPSLGRGVPGRAARRTHRATPIGHAGEPPWLVKPAEGGHGAARGHGKHAHPPVEERPEQAGNPRVPPGGRPATAT